MSYADLATGAVTIDVFFHGDDLLGNHLAGQLDGAAVDDCVANHRRQ